MAKLQNLKFLKLRSWFAGLTKPQPQIPPYAHIVQIGDPVLRTPASPIAIEFLKTQEFKFILAHLKYVLNLYKCVGLSGPQIGVPMRIIALEFNKNHAKVCSKEEFKNKEMSLVAQTVIVNPELKVTDFDIVSYPEGCLSVKGFTADVGRYRSVKVTGLNEVGESIAMEATGWTARILQHELDHLDGKLYTDVMNRKTLACSCWDIVNERRGKVVLPYGPG